MPKDVHRMVALDSSLLEGKRQFRLSLVSRVNRTSGVDCTICDSMYQPTDALNKNIKIWQE
jgi:hypothetical protein